MTGVLETSATQQPVPAEDGGSPDAEPLFASTASNVGDLSGQYYVHVVYSNDRRHVVRTAVVTNRQSLLARNIGRNIANSEPQSHLSSLLDEHKKISGYAAIGHQTCSEVSTLPTLRLRHELDKELGKSIERVKKRVKSDLFVSRTLDNKNVSDSISKYWHSISHGYAVQNAIFVGMVTTFDELIAQLIRNVLKHTPEILNSFALQIPYKDVVGASDFSSLQERLIRDLVDDLMWKGRLDQLKWLEQTITKDKFSESIPDFEKFIEIAERRNIYVHNNGIVNSNYASRVDIKKAGVSGADIGKRLYVTETYFKESADVLVEAYVVIVQKVIRKLMRGATNEQRENLDTQFNQAVYDQLDGARDRSAARLAATMLGGGFEISDMTRKMGSVNLGIALKRLGDEEASRKALDSVDWSSARTEFRLCIAAIKEEDEEVYRLLPQMNGSDLIVPQSYFDWPAFEWMRSKPDFWSKLQDVYGDTIKKAAEDPALSG
jgi:hypothetical protein